MGLGGIRILENLLIWVINEKKRRHKFLVLMLNLKVSKQTRSEARKIVHNQKNIKYTSKLNKSK